MTSRLGKFIDWATVLLGAVALVISCFLFIHALSGGGLIGCSAGTSCSAVLGSRWSWVLGRIPVSGLSALVYIALLVCLIFGRKLEDDPQFARLVGRFVLVLSGAILGAAIWFIWLQKVRIRAFCPYCMTAHICGAVLSLIVLIRSAEPLWRRLLLLLAGLALAGALAGLQIATTPLTAYDRGFVPESLPQVDPEQLPSVGDASAEHVVTLLFDYRCSHCQKIHSLLPEVVSQLGNAVIVTMPVPLSRECNPYVPDGEDRFKGSCELAKLALALWRTDRDAFNVFDSWLFETDSVLGQDAGWYPREPEDARAKASSLLGGEEALDAALADPWIDSTLSIGMEIFGRTSTNSSSAIPRFICGDTWLVPDADDAAGLAGLISSLVK